MLVRRLLLAPLLLAAAALIPAPRPVTRLSAIYNHGTLALTIPYQSQQEDSGTLTTEILDPEDHVVARSEHAAETTKGSGAWRQTIPTDLAYEDLIWDRIRYRFNAAHTSLETTDSISAVLRRPLVHLLGQTEYLANSTAVLRVIVSDAALSTPLDGTIYIALESPGQKPQTLFTGRLNNRGTLEASVRFPAKLSGKFDLHITADTPIGSTDYTQPITLADKASILLTTEKPLYQPGQTIHIRALALDRTDHKATASRPLTFELEDGRGNKVFKRVTTTDDYGIASAEFTLADEVNLGTYHLRALMADNNAEVALNVERYVLPKFKVAIDFTQQNNKPRRDFRPGEHVTGTVHANYFFGKPVDHAELTLKLTSADVEIVEEKPIAGKTDADGAYKFDLKLPAYFAGKPLSQGAARALLEATVKDNAAHSETRGEPITVSQSALLLTAIPESGMLIPHIENQVYLLSAYPDGTPAPTSLTVGIPDGATQHVTTDQSGVAVIRFVPEPNIWAFYVEADDHHGASVKTDVPVRSRNGTDHILLRADRAVYKTGDRIHLKVLSTRQQGTAYIDLVKSGQTILTRDVDLTNGEADLTVTATPELAGTLDADAYLFSRDAQPIADHRLLFVQPANELKVTATPNQPLYKPGEEARIAFRVTNAHGEGVAAALGLQIVDEAVFALAEKQPGFAKVFFFLEQEVMKPRYEIHSFTAETVVEDSEQDLAARALFSATEMAAPTRLDTEFGRSLPQQKFGEYRERYRQAFVAQIRVLADKLNRSPQTDTVKAFNTARTGVYDAWGGSFHIEPSGSNWSNARFYRVSSAGPDHRFDTPDDLSVFIETTTGFVGDHEQHGGHADVRIEHDRGPIDGHAQIAGNVLDTSGALIPGAVITARMGNVTRTTHGNDRGEFLLLGLAPGRYQVEIRFPGFEVLTTSVTLQARDLALFHSVLNVGSVTQTVNVSAGAVVVEEPFAVKRAMGGVMGGLGRAVAAPMAKVQFAAEAVDVVSQKQVENLPLESRSFTTVKAAAPDAPHVRSYFPEALYINPEILTDAQGNATITIPVADSITTWRMAMLASTRDGAIGMGTGSLKVFQDFFADLDLPVTLTQGDRVTLPVAIYNYTGKAGETTLKLQHENWFTLDNDTEEKQVHIASGQVGGSQFTLNANRIGKFKLTLTARMAGAAGTQAHDDIVVREIEIVPNGREQSIVFNGRLNSTEQHDIVIPANAIPDASSLLVRLYPGPLSQVIEGMDSILQMPGGCFEQTSSSTYPNVLALDYMKRTKKLTPEVHAKAEGYIANGYQRLLTFEVPDGGFSWFGQSPANKILTAYGLMEFNDMSKVAEVDPKVIERTRAWLAGQQQADGSWKPDTSFINEGATNRYNSNVLRITAYIAWALANTGDQGIAVQKAKHYIESYNGPTPDTYTLAVIANFAADYAKDRAFTDRAAKALIEARTEKGDQVSWAVEETGVYSTGKSAAIETTGLATQAIVKWGRAPETVRKALNFLAASKGAQGNWGTTQATIMALRALLVASDHASSDVRGTVEVMLDGKQIETLTLTPENNDLFHQFVVKQIDPFKLNHVQLHFSGTGSLAYQIVGRYFTPWETKAAVEPLTIKVNYDRTHLAQNDIATETVTIHNSLPKTANMIMVDLGIPPGFDLLSEDLQAFQEKSANAASGGLQKFSLTATQAILYFNALASNQTVTIKVRLRARYPIRAHTFQSRVYEYYDPAINATAHPVQMEVTTH
jgi:hypothetical protein